MSGGKAGLGVERGQAGGRFGVDGDGVGTDERLPRVDDGGKPDVSNGVEQAGRVDDHRRRVVAGGEEFARLKKANLRNKIGHGKTKQQPRDEPRLLWVKQAADDQ